MFIRNSSFQILKISFVILNKFSFVVYLNLIIPVYYLYIYIYVIKKDISNVGEYKSFLRIKKHL